MTMIRINLIAEKKAGAPKVAKKSTGQTSELQENMIIIVSIFIAALVCGGIYMNVNNRLSEVRSKEAGLKKKWNELKVWQDKLDEYEIRSKILNEKIQKISELKEGRQGPVKLMEDIHNLVPESVWLTSIHQGYDKSLLNPTASGRKKAAAWKNVGSKYLIRIVGQASSQEAITNFANRVINLDKSYYKTDLNEITRANGQSNQLVYNFSLFFEIRKNEKPDEETN